MARFWVSGGDGNWNNTNNWSDTTGGSSGSSVPTSSDDVYFDGNSGSGTSTVNVESNSLGLDFTGFTGTLAGSSTLNIYASLTMASGMTRTFSGEIYFLGTGSYTITSAGKTFFGNFYFGPDSTTGGTYTLQDTFNTGSRAMYLRSGTLDTNSQTVTAAIRASGTSGNNRTLTLGSSVISANAIYFPSYYTLILNEGTSHITITGNNTFSGGEETWYDVTIAGSSTWGSISAANTFHNLSINGTSGTNLWWCSINTNQTVTGTFSVTGTSLTERIWLKSATEGVARTITAANVSISNMDFTDITGAGTGTWSGTSVGNGGGNSGITSTSTVTRHWVATSGGNWSATSSWSNSSGGGSGYSVPLCHDTIVFDSNSISSPGQTIDIDIPRTPAIDFSNITNSPDVDLNNNLFVFGGLDLSSINSFTFAGSTHTVEFWGRSSHSIDTAGYLFNITYFQTGTATLTSNFTASSLYDLKVGSAATFDADTYNVSAGRIDLDGTTYLGSGTWTCSGSGGFTAVFSGGGTIHSETSTIIVTSTSANIKYWNGTDETYNNLIITGNYVRISGNNTFNTLTLNNAGETDGTIFYSGSTQTITNFSTNGSAGNLAKISSHTPSSAFRFSKSSGAIEEDYMDIKDCEIRGAGHWFAGLNSTNSGGNEGWVFNVSDSIIDYYSEGNANTWRQMRSGSTIAASQSFTAVAGIITSAKLSLYKSNSPTGNAIVKIYAHSGTYGTSSIPTGSALAISDNFDVSTLGTSGALETFTFSGSERITLTGSTYYTIVLEYSGGDSSNLILYGNDGASGTHSGNLSEYVIAWTPDDTDDLIFYLFRSTPVSQTVQAKGRTQQIESRTATAKGDIFQAGTTKTVTAKGKIVTTYINTCTAKGRIQQTEEETITSKGDLKKSGVTRTVTAKGKIMFTYENTITAKGRIEKTETQTITTKGRTSYGEQIIDSYSESNQDQAAWLSDEDNLGLGQSFTGDGGVLNNCEFYLKRGGSPSGNIYAKIYAHSGVFGTSSIPTGSALATSVAVNVSVLTDSYRLVRFEFNGGEKITLSNGTRYVVTIEYNSDPWVSVGYDHSSPSHNGNLSFTEGSWIAQSSSDFCFYVYRDKTLTQTIASKGNIETTTEQTVTAKGRIETTEDQTIQAKGNVKATTDQTVTSKGNIEVTTEQTTTSKGNIKVTTTQTVTAKARIVNTYSSTISAKGGIKVLGETKTIEAKGDILYVRTNTIDSKGLIKALGVTKTIGAKARVRFFHTQTIEAKASIKNTTKHINAKGRIITDWQIAQPKLGATVLPFPSKASIKRIRHKGDKDTIAGRKKHDNMGEKYQYKMSWRVIRPTDFDALEEEIKTGEPVVFRYDKWPQSSGAGIAVLGTLSPRKYVYGTGTTEYLSNVSVTLTEARPR